MTQSPLDAVARGLLIFKSHLEFLLGDGAPAPPELSPPRLLTKRHEGRTDYLISARSSADGDEYSTGGVPSKQLGCNPGDILSLARVTRRSTPRQRRKQAEKEEKQRHARLGRRLSVEGDETLTSTGPDGATDGAVRTSSCISFLQPDDAGRDGSIYGSGYGSAYGSMHGTSEGGGSPTSPIRSFAPLSPRSLGFPPGSSTLPSTQNAHGSSPHSCGTRGHGQWEEDDEHGDGRGPASRRGGGGMHSHSPTSHRSASPDSMHSGESGHLSNAASGRQRGRTSSGGPHGRSNRSRMIIPTSPRNRRPPTPPRDARPDDFDYEVEQPPSARVDYEHRVRRIAPIPSDYITTDAYDRWAIGGPMAERATTGLRPISTIPEGAPLPISSELASRRAAYEALAAGVGADVAHGDLTNTVLAALARADNLHASKERVAIIGNGHAQRPIEDSEWLLKMMRLPMWQAGFVPPNVVGQHIGDDGRVVEVVEDRPSAIGASPFGAAPPKVRAAVGGGAGGATGGAAKTNALSRDALEQLRAERRAAKGEPYEPLTAPHVPAPAPAPAPALDPGVPGAAPAPSGGISAPAASRVLSSAEAAKAKRRAKGAAHTPAAAPPPLARPGHDPGGSPPVTSGGPPVTPGGPSGGPPGDHMEKGSLNGRAPASAEEEAQRQGRHEGRQAANGPASALLAPATACLPKCLPPAEAAAAAVPVEPAASDPVDGGASTPMGEVGASGDAVETSSASLPTATRAKAAPPNKAAPTKAAPTKATHAKAANAKAANAKATPTPTMAANAKASAANQAGAAKVSRVPGAPRSKAGAAPVAPADVYASLDDLHHAGVGVSNSKVSAAGAPAVPPLAPIEATASTQGKEPGADGGVEA